MDYRVGKVSTAVECASSLVCVSLFHILIATRAIIIYADVVWIFQKYYCSFMCKSKLRLQTHKENNILSILSFKMEVGYRNIFLKR